MANPPKIQILVDINAVGRRNCDILLLVILDSVVLKPPHPLKLL